MKGAVCSLSVLVSAVEPFLPLSMSVFMPKKASSVLCVCLPPSFEGLHVLAVFLAAAKDEEVLVASWGGDFFLPLLFEALDSFSLQSDFCFLMGRLPVVAAALGKACCC